MSLTNILLIVIAIGVSVMAAKLENAIRLLGQISTDFRRSTTQAPSDSKPLEWHLSRFHDHFAEACALLSRIESHTGYLTEPVKEARMKEIIDAVPKQS